MGTVAVEEAVNVEGRGGGRPVCALWDPPLGIGTVGVYEAVLVDGRSSGCPVHTLAALSRVFTAKGVEVNLSRGRSR